MENEKQFVVAYFVGEEFIGFRSDSVGTVSRFAKTYAYKEDSNIFEIVKKQLSSYLQYKKDGLTPIERAAAKEGVPVSNGTVAKLFNGIAKSTLEKLDSKVADARMRIAVAYDSMPVSPLHCKILEVTPDESSEEFDVKQVNFRKPLLEIEAKIID